MNDEGLIIDEQAAWREILDGLAHPEQPIEVAKAVFLYRHADYRRADVERYWRLSQLAVALQATLAERFERALERLAPYWSDAKGETVGEVVERLGLTPADLGLPDFALPGDAQGFPTVPADLDAARDLMAWLLLYPPSDGAP